jgi:hypothetical protein
VHTHSTVEKRTSIKVVAVFFSWNHLLFDFLYVKFWYWKLACAEKLRESWFVCIANLDLLFWSSGYNRDLQIMSSCIQKGGCTRMCTK